MRYKKLTKKGFLEDFTIPAFFILLIIGFALSFLIENKFVNYFVVFLAGLVFGKACYHKKDDYMFHYVMLSAGFVFGYVAGNRTGNYMAVLLIFITGLIASYYAHKKGVF